MDYLKLKPDQKLEVSLGDQKFILRVPSATDYLYATAYTTYGNRIRLFSGGERAQGELDEVAAARARELCKLCIVDPKEFDPWSVSAVLWQQFLRPKVEILCGQQTVVPVQPDPMLILATPPGRTLEYPVGPLVIVARMPSALESERLRAAIPELDAELTVPQLQEAWHRYTAKLFEVTDVKLDWTQWSAPLLAHVTLFLMSCAGQRPGAFRDEESMRVLEDVGDVGAGDRGVSAPNPNRDELAGSPGDKPADPQTPQRTKKKLGTLTDRAAEA